jgi:hypothetical protein
VSARRRWWRRLRPATLVGVIGAVVALLVGLTALVDWIAKRTSDPPPAHIDAQIVSAKALNYDVPLIAHLRDNGEPTRGLTPTEAHQLGRIFSVRVRLRGNLGREIPLRWWMFERDSETARPVLPRSLYAQTAGRFEPQSQDHSRTVELWLPYPPEPGVYFVRFALLDEKKRPYDLTTAPFRVPRVPPL